MCGASRCRPGNWFPASGIAIALLTGYVILLPFVHPLIPAILAVAAITWILSTAFAPRHRVGLTALMVLGLPVIPSIQTHLGFPLRLMAAAGAGWSLRLLGLDVTRDGVSLVWQNSAVLVDEPCSGVRMLWSGLVLSMALAALCGFGVVRTTLFALIGIVIVILGNLVRSVFLFFLEAGFIQGPDWFHPAIGIVAFAGSACLLVAAAYGTSRFSLERLRLPPVAKRIDATFRWSIIITPGLAAPVLALLLVTAAVIPFFPQNASGTPTPVTNFPGWISEFEGRPLTPVAMTKRERLFYQDFPGEVASFTDGERQVILRWAGAETKKFHLSRNCLAGVGYNIDQLPDHTDADGKPWGLLKASRGSETLLARERIADANGSIWTNEPAWRWARLLRRTQPPWWGITIIDRVDLPSPLALNEHSHENAPK